MPDSHVIFRLGAHTLAVPLEAVASVERPGRVTQVPFAAPWLRGVTAVRGAIVSVIDLGRFAGSEPAGLSPGARLLVTRGASATAALLVDGVNRIGAATATHARPADDAPLAPWCRATLHLDGAAVPVVDPDLLMGSDAFMSYQQPLGE
jgi:purine-binding chemotaxis protein CheW